MKYRIEIDSLGDMEVPRDAYYGAHTARVLENYPIGEDLFPPAFIAALGQIKRAAAEANAEFGELSGEKAGWIVRAATEVATGELDEHFPLPIWQTGSGTGINMNANEVIAGRANELACGDRGGRSPVHPNDDVNRSQSSNDVIPTAMHMAAASEITNRLLPALDELCDALAEKAAENAHVVKLGRTHMMDAVPITVGQEFSGYLNQIEAGIDRLDAALDGLHELAIGGTAVGTGLNAPPGFADSVLARLIVATGLPYRLAADPFAAQAAHDADVAASAALRGLAVSLMKIANDIRLLASGPRGGLGEIRLPALEAGSSIMPGKVNPGQAEALSMVCAQVIGNDAAIAIGGMSGHLELNAYKPLIIANLLHSIEILGDACRSFAKNCITGLVVDAAACKRHVDRSLMLVTALAPRLGYDRCAEIAYKALEEDLTLKAAAVALGFLSEAEYDELVWPEEMTGL